MLNIASIVTAAIHLALFIAGLVLAFTLRRDDRRAGMLAALGFGCEIVALLVWVVLRMAVTAVIHSVFGPVAGSNAVDLAITLGGRLFEIAGFVLIFAALLRRVRASRAAVEARS